MATKTISLELDAYDKLKTAKRSERESFSSVVRRARFEGGSGFGSSILTVLQRLHSDNRLISEEALDRLEEVRGHDVDSPRVTPSKWEARTH
jgi:hypothetical protein